MNAERPNSIGLAVIIGGFVMLCVIAALATNSGITTMVHTSTLAWPVRPVAPDGTPQQSGWVVSQRFGWDSSSAPFSFHEGLGIESPDRQCPMGPRCEVVSSVDGLVTFIGTHPTYGQTVIVANGDGEYELVYGRLEPYRHYIRIEGRIDDPYGRYDAFADFQPIGDDPLLPGVAVDSIAIQCTDPAPEFTLVDVTADGFVFEYDAPATGCTTSIRWGQRGDDWQGWIPESPETVSWSTAIAGTTFTARALDVGVRFRAKLVPPPPPPPDPTPTPALPGAPVPGSDDSDSNDHGGDDPSQGSRMGGDRAEQTQKYGDRDYFLGDACRPDNAPCVWTVAVHPYAPTASDVDISLSSPKGGMIRPGETLPLSLVATSMQSDMHIQVILPPGWSLVTLSTPTPQCTVSGDVGQCQAGTVAVFTAQVRAPETAIPGTIVTIGAQIDGGGQTKTTTMDMQVVALPPSDPYPAPDDPSAMTTVPVIEIRPTPAPIAQPAPSVCRFQPIVPLPGVVNAYGTGNGMALVASAAQSFQSVRQEIITMTGRDLLAQLADALRMPEFATSKAGVSFTSWHKTGRAIDLSQTHPWIRVREGNKWRLFFPSLSGVPVDITALFERHGWRRIPDRADSVEWWHYEYTEGLSWASAMKQAWWNQPDRLAAAFPSIPWESIGCVGDSIEESPIILAERGDRCTPTPPPFDAAVSSAPGCGPPVVIGTEVRQLTDIVGFIGGRSLFFGLRQHGINGIKLTNVCDPAWLQTIDPTQTDGRCVTDMVDPAIYLPFDANGNPVQLPPPSLTDRYLDPARTPSGLYWSPHRRTGPYGGSGGD